MNKKSIITLLLAIAAMAGQAQSNQQLEQSSDTRINWKLEGTVDNAEPTDTLFIVDLEEQRDVASLQVNITEEKQNTSDQTLFNQNIYKIVNGIVEKHPRP